MDTNGAWSAEHPKHVSARHVLLGLSLAALCQACAGGGGSGQAPTAPSGPSHALVLESVRPGVVASPAQNTSYTPGTVVSYRFVTREGRPDVYVTLDGARVQSSGTVTMDRDHTFRAAVDTEPGAQMIDFEGRTADGRTLRLSDYRGRIVFLDFSAITCEGSVVAAPVLRAHYNAYRSRGLEIITVLEDCPALHDCAPDKLATPADLDAWQRTYNLPFPVVSDPQNVTRIYNYSEKEGGSSFPAGYLVDAAGVIRYRFAGFNDAALRAALATLFP